MTDPETFFQQTYRDLMILKERQARYKNQAGVPPALLDQIENYERAIFLTRQRLDGLINERDWREALKSVPLADIPTGPINEAEPTPVAESEKPPSGPTYRLTNIRALLTSGFSDSDLRNFCFDQPEFREVYEQLAEQTGKEEIVSLIMEHADQHLLFDLLLEWAKERNPARYKQDQPYIGSGEG